MLSHVLSDRAYALEDFAYVALTPWTLSGAYAPILVLFALNSSIVNTRSSIIFHKTSFPLRWNLHLKPDDRFELYNLWFGVDYRVDIEVLTSPL